MKAGELYRLVHKFEIVWRSDRGDCEFSERKYVDVMRDEIFITTGRTSATDKIIEIFNPDYGFMWTYLVYLESAM